MSNEPDDIQRIDLGIDVAKADPAELIDLGEAAKLVRGRHGGHANRQVLQRFSSPKRGRLFRVGGATYRLVLPTVSGLHCRLTTPAWVEAWKKKYAELSDLQREGKLPGENP